jgi:hypothetical protein
MDPLNALSTTTAARKIPPLKEAPPAKVMSCALVASTDLEKDLDDVKEVTGGASVPSAKMAGVPANSPGRPTMVCGHSAPVMRVNHHQHAKVPLVLEGHRMHPDHALSPRPTIWKEHRSVTPTRPTTGILTSRKVIAWCQLVVPSSSSDDDLPLVKHDAWVDLNPSGMRIR